MHIVITGAAGTIGSQMVEELQPAHELRLIDIRPVAARPSILADLAKPSGWSNAFAGADAVVHLAANIQATATWPEVLGDNIEATWNVLEAVATHRVPRVVFASSNWVVKALERKLAPNCYLPNGPKIGSDADPCPVNPYGLSKAFGETAGRMFVDQGRLTSFVAVRIGYYDVIPARGFEYSNLWIETDDMRKLLRRCVEASFAGFHVIYGVSAQPSAPYDLTHTKSLISWEPKQTMPEASDPSLLNRH